MVLALTIADWQTPAFLSAPPPSTVEAMGATPPAGPVAERRLEKIVDSLGATDFPVLEPGLQDLGTASWAREVDERVCFDVSAATARDCVFGDRRAPRTAVVLGDAFGAAWMAAVLRALPSDQYRVHQITRSQCPAWDVPMDPGGTGPAECDDHRQWAFGEVDRIEPDLLILSSYHYRGYEIANVARTDSAVAEAVGAGLAATLARTSAAAASTVVLAPPPGAGNLQECASGSGSPDDCARDIPVLWTGVAGAESSAAGAAGATYIDTSGWFCAARRCPGFIGSTPVTVDGAHISWRTSVQVGIVLREALRKAGAVPAATLR